ncbi:PREDICTED: kinesin-like protein KIN-12C isoform X2 [Tarenaya hassleriana]|nr:PREDICTED: kinesin-like protein KIN-12C isoform X2 [Tarenaya hassleriana]
MKGVYVENLVEHKVRNVNDVLKLLLQGAANRKIAATHMNSESSRSHSVLTCTIESRWETDSLTHFRFARLNLVDLAGSERQKSSGAEGDRLKEAANINKSLSTLGLVIMSLVDLAHGKHRHVPYRDSRLTFLLQDSLGGNSKTMIIANVSPSVCSANETLSTLKFAQRAKLIQNNAKVNEDSSGDVTALQHEIRKLKGQLSSLMKNQNSSKVVSDCLPSRKESRYSGINEIPGELLQYGCQCQMHSPLIKKVKSMKEILTGALRREKVAETVLEKSKAEIECTNSLVKHMEEDAQFTKMMLSLREEKVKQLEMLISSSLTSEDYLMEENKILKGEIKLLQESMSRQAQLTHCALDNIRLQEQLQIHQNFYELGEREKLLAEISELRDQLLDILEANSESFSGCVMKDDKVERELENCRKMNSSMIRKLDVMHRGLGRCLNFDQTADLGETMSIRSDWGEDIVCSAQEKETLERNNWSDMNSAASSDHSNIRKELMESRSLIEAMEVEPVQLINEMMFMREDDRYRETLRKIENNEREPFPKIEAYDGDFSGLDLKNEDAVMGIDGGIEKYILQLKLEKLSKDLEEARKLNCHYEKDRKLKLSQQQDIKLVCEHVETETSRTILHLQEELIALQSEFEERICNLTQENRSLKDTITAREAEIKTLNQDWEKATIELTSFIVDGSKSIKEASTQIESIICSFPHVNAWIGDYVEKAAKVCFEKEETVLLLQKSLEDAQILLAEMDLKLKSLKGATIVLNEVQLQDNVVNVKQMLRLSTETKRMSNVADKPENEFESRQHQILEAERRSEATLAVRKWLSTSTKVFEGEDIDNNVCRPHLASSINGRCNLSCEKPNDNLLRDHDTSAIEVTSNGGTDRDSDIHSLFTDIQVHLGASTMDFLQMYSSCKHLVQDVIREIHEIRFELLTLKKNHGDMQIQRPFQSGEPYKPWITSNQFEKGEKIKDQACIFSSKEKYLSEEVHGRGEDFSTSSSDFSICNAGQTANMIYPGILLPESEDQETHDKAMSLASVNENDSGHGVYCEEGQQAELVPLALMKERKEMEYKLSNRPSSEVYAGLIQRMDPARSFFKQFEAVNATMKEADLTLRQLVEANGKSKQVIGMWCQTNEELMVERTSLMEDLEQLRCSVSLCEKENQFLLDQTHSTLVDMKNSMSLLEEIFLQMKRGVEKTLEALYSNVLLTARELLHLIGTSRKLLEQMFSETMESGFALYVIQQCHIGKLLDQMDQSKRTITTFPWQEKQPFMESNTSRSSSEDNVSRQVDGANIADGVTELKNGVVYQSRNNLIYENLFLKKELERKEALFEGLLFDFRLLQESASNKRDIKDETDELIDALCQIRQELGRKTIQVHDLVFQKEKLENCSSDLQKALFSSKSDLEKAEERIHALTEKNGELRVLLKDLCLKKTAAEEALEEQKELVKGLESEIIYLTNTAEAQVLSSVRAIEEDLKEVSGDKEQLLDEIRSLNDKLDMAYAIADEKEAIAIEARQESEASKMYAEQKEEEVKILEISVEELENTVNVLEKRVYDMDAEVERHRMIRDSSETELQTLRQRLLRVENFNLDIDECEDKTSRSKELQEAHYQIQLLEKEVAEMNKEIKQLREYISEVVLHSEAQACGYQEKYKGLEAMVRDLKIDASNTSTAATSHKTEKSSSRTRGSGSPFRCIAGLVQQMNLEKDQELTMARFRIEELESLLAVKQREVCSLNTRIAAAESMTHDVIRDLLGVKMDMTNYANLVDHYQFGRVVEEAHQRTEEILSKEQEIIKLKKHIAAFVEERERCISELKEKEAGVLANQITLEQLQEQVQLLSAQNDMLKKDKTNLLRRVAELDQKVKTFVDAPGSSSQCVTQTPRDTRSIKLMDTDYSKRLEHAQKLLSHANNELAKYCKTGNSQPPVLPAQGPRRSSGTSFR